MSEHIMITCPVGNSPVRTGYRALRGAAMDGLKQIKLKHCPHCGGEHLWDGKDGYWEDQVEAPAFWAGFRQIWRGSRHASAPRSR